MQRWTSAQCEGGHEPGRLWRARGWRRGTGRAGGGRGGSLAARAQAGLIAVSPAGHTPGHTDVDTHTRAHTVVLRREKTRL